MADISLQIRLPTPSEHEYIARSLFEHTAKASGLDVATQDFAIFAYDGDKQIGAIIGKIYFNWLHLDLVWVEEDCRLQKIGRKLIESAVYQSKSNNLSGIEVWTQSWQAPDFYRRLNFEEFAVIDDFTPGNKRHAFRLYL